MSFILDALRKSDKKRPQGHAPDLGTEHFVAQPRSSRRGLLILGIVAVVVVLNGAIWLWWASRPSVPTQSPPPTEMEVAKKAEPVAAPPSGAVKPQIPAEVASPPAAGPLPVSETTPAVPVVPQGDVGRTLIVTDRKEPEPRPAETSVAAPVEDSRPAELKIESTEKLAEPVVTPAAPPAEILVDEVPAEFDGVEEPGGVLALRDLPSSMRAGLPDFSFSLHYYTAEPTQRMVRINGRMLREGQLLQDDLLLEEITPGGAIFSHRDLRFEVVRY